MCLVCVCVGHIRVVLYIKNTSQQAFHIPQGKNKGYSESRSQPALHSTALSCLKDTDKEKRRFWRRREPSCIYEHWGVAKMHQIRNCEPFRAVTFIDVSGDTSPSVLRLEVDRYVRFSSLFLKCYVWFVFLFMHSYLLKLHRDLCLTSKTCLFLSSSPLFSSHKYIEYSHNAIPGKVTHCGIHCPHQEKKTKRKQRVCLPLNHFRSIHLKYEGWFVRMVYLLWRFRAIIYSRGWDGELSDKRNFDSCKWGKQIKPTWWCWIVYDSILEFIAI